MQEIIDACSAIGLGVCQVLPVAQTGGSLHSMWRVCTDKGEFALKRINQKNLSLLGGRVSSQHDSQQLSTLPFEIRQHQGEDWLIRAWVSGHCLEPGACTVEHAKALGELVRVCHARKNRLVALSPDWHQLDVEKWQRLIVEAEQKKRNWAPLYRDALPKITNWAERINATTEVFCEHTIISHRDISASNVVWSEAGQPTLIDWEFAGRIHPQLECFIVMMNFDLNEPSKKAAFFEHYGAALTLSEDLLLSGYLGYCLDWLEFNMERSLYYPQQNMHSDPQLIDYLAFLLAQDF